MKFTDGYWQTRPGIDPLYAVEVDDVRVDEAAGTMTVYAPTAVIHTRGDTLNRPMITVTYSSPAPGVVKVRVEHFAGAARRGPDFAVSSADGYRPVVKVDETSGVLETGGLTVRAHRGGRWHVDFEQDGRVLTSSLPKSVGVMTTAHGVTPPGSWVHEQLTIDPGEHVYGLGERFGPFVKNGQSVDIWNEDGGTSSEQAYKNVPFYVTSKGYGVFVAHPERVSFEVASEVNTRVQFSVAGQALEYYLVGGPTPKDVLRRYSGLTGRPAEVPAWSYGLWLSTSFTTDYDEATVTSFVDGMAERGLPLSVFHFDCFWMREYQWCDFEWDPRVFPDPEGMLARLHERGLQVSAWINPYIAQRAALFGEAVEKGYLLRTSDGGVWQWDKWQAGMGLVDFTNPEAKAWYVGHLERLLDQGVDCFKTDFGERIPADGVVWHDGSDPQRMHNYYAQLYNQTVFELLERRRGKGEAVLFARSATAGGQQLPVHWGGDCDSTYASMAESLRGGLSLGLSGFGYWSHDIGGFEGTPDAGVFKRWAAFGLLSSHSRLHGSHSYRVPWAFDEEAVDVTRRFTRLKLSLMPYLAGAAEQATGEGTPIMRAMALEFPGDRGTFGVDTQYMLGDALLVAPVFTADGEVEYYVPEGTWTRLVDGADGAHAATVTGPRWVTETHGFDSLPVLVRPGTVLPVGARSDRPDYAWADGVELRLFELPDGYDAVTAVPTGGPGQAPARFRVRRDGDRVTVSTDDAPGAWSVRTGDRTASGRGAEVVTLDL
ncbi:alpha-xylosidase [Isoptericola sp. NEAU-Y5]|uniref:Alpha-xylosidase n=1 Tax=Isoptericola luteus TaxID=2879484 RepID=A0ABS7ZJ30_9MICO|nr:alpha-xylosidase [Isoptericola sp. NEAU-Y5]MCA5893809.1 alpha-xylosidase [Isoptericola sp. NEAU-Y5]